MYSDAEIKSAIRDKRLVELTYGGDRRVAEPHVLGTRNGTKQLLSYQVGGTSRSGPLPDWRCFDLPKISGFRILQETFAGAREDDRFRNTNFDIVHAVVSR